MGNLLLFAMDSTGNGLMKSSVEGLEFVILQFLKKKPMRGFDIIKGIFQRFGVFLTQGEVYPILRKLAKEGKIKKYKGDSIYVYSITREGEDCLNSLGRLGSE